MKTFEQILKDAPDISVLLDEHDRYWAHIHSTREHESLAAHINLVNYYSGRLIETHGLDEVVDNLLKAYTADWGDRDANSEFLKTLFTGVIVFHDFGKINENFQVLRMKNLGNFSLAEKTFLKPPHGHSYLGTFIFLCHYIQKALALSISDESKSRLICHCFFFSYSIMQHHSPALYDVMERDGFLTHFKDSLEPLKEYLTKFRIDPGNPVLSVLLTNADKIWNGAVKNNLPYIPFPLFALIKLNYSVLTAADYLATHEYMNSSEGGREARTADFGVLNRGRINDIIDHLQSYKHNAAVFRDAEGYNYLHPVEQSNSNLNLLRKEMAVELIHQLKRNNTGRLFYLEAPTGGGKTNLSSIAVTELLRADERLTKVFYVFPFTTLITQTFAALKESMGLQQSEIVELHSKAAFAGKREFSEEQEEDGLFGEEKKDFIDNLFALYPITLLSHVKFFDILKTNRKESNYLLHRMANSIVIIDEIQSYNPQIWDKMLYYINNFAHFFNMRFVLMSATLPKISGLKVGLTQAVPFIDLLPNASRYITNPNFARRVLFNFELYNQNEISLESLAESVIQKSEGYAAVHGSVRTIIEFIYKRSASAFHRLLQGNTVFDEVFVLSGTVLEPRRREIINFIKRTSGEQKSILLITTQVVEAGVDIDMDLGFKNVSLLDSDEQLAGRVNRNALKSGCEVYLFKADDARILYGKDHRYTQTRETISTDQYQEILKNKDFKVLYEKVLTHIDGLNNPLYKDSISGYEAEIAGLRFPDIDRNFKIIDQDNIPVFVPLIAPVKVAGAREGTEDEIFTADDLKFLERFNVSSEEFLFDDGQKPGINGQDVWDLYESLILGRIQSRKQNSHIDIGAMSALKTLQSIMAKFSFSLISRSADYQKIQAGFGEEKYGYLYFSYWDEARENGKPYEYKNGLNNDAFSDANFI